MRIIRFFPLAFLLAGCLAVFLAAGTNAWAPVAEVSAQCSRPSSCKTCHETQGFAPVNALGDWHTQHGMFDFCADCHGGDKLAADQAAAHVGIVTGLNDVQSACQNCHTNNWREKLDIYASAAGITLGPMQPRPTSAAPAQPTPDPLGAFLGTGPVGVAVPSAPAQPDPDQLPAVPPVNTTGNLILGGLTAAVAAGGGTYIFTNEQKKRSQRAASPTAAQEPVSIIPGFSEQVSSLLPRIAALDGDAVDALDCILDDPRSANEYLPRLADLLEENLLEPVAQLTPRTRALLAALTNPPEETE